MFHVEQLHGSCGCNGLTENCTYDSHKSDTNFYAPHPLFHVKQNHSSDALQANSKMKTNFALWGNTFVDSNKRLSWELDFIRNLLVNAWLRHYYRNTEWVLQQFTELHTWRHNYQYSRTSTRINQTILLIRKLTQQVKIIICNRSA